MNACAPAIFALPRLTAGDLPGERSDATAGPSSLPGLVRVVIAEDHPPYRESLAQLLREMGIEVMAEVTSGEEAIRAAEDTAPDVVILDLKMPGLSGEETIRRLTAEMPATNVLVLSVSADECDVADAVLAGASGYLLKDASMEVVIGAVRATAAGEALISPLVATALLRRLPDLADAGIDSADPPLSSVELEVLGLIAEGNSDFEIADRLAIPLSTLHVHTANILMKLQSRLRSAGRG